MQLSGKTKLISSVFLLSAISILSYKLSAQSEISSSASLNTMQEKINYSIGVDMGKQFHQTDFEFIPEAFLSGIKDGQQDTLQLSEDEMNQIKTQFQQMVMEKMQAKQQKLALENLEKSKAFLADNKQNTGIQETNSGLQYKVLEEGQGAHPSATDVVTVNYVGKTIDGNEFDSSYKRQEPTKLQLNYVIPGWQEALMMMKPGSKWEIYIPPKLAYGEAGAGNVIEPNEALIFEIELVSIEETGHSLDETQQAPESE